MVLAIKFPRDEDTIKTWCFSKSIRIKPTPTTVWLNNWSIVLKCIRLIKKCLKMRNTRLLVLAINYSNRTRHQFVRSTRTRHQIFHNTHIRNRHQIFEDPRTRTRHQASTRQSTRTHDRILVPNLGNYHLKGQQILKSRTFSDHTRWRKHE